MPHKSRESIDQQQQALERRNANWTDGYHFVIYKGKAGAAYFSKVDNRWHAIGMHDPLDDEDFDRIFDKRLVEEKSGYGNMLIGFLGGLLGVILIYILSNLDLL